MGKRARERANEAALAAIYHQGQVWRMEVGFADYDPGTAGYWAMQENYGENMSMIRINQSIRMHVIHALLKKKYVKEDLALEDLSKTHQEQQEQLEKLAYEAAFDAPMRKLLTSAAKGLFPEQSDINVRIQKGDASNYYDTAVHFGQAMPVPFRNSHWGGRSFAAVLDENSPYVKAMAETDKTETAWNEAKNDLAGKKRADSARIGTIIDSVTTVKRLQEIWPEVIDYLPETVSGPDGQLPVEMIADINASFGLTK